jgi:hypothetical protein
LIVGFIALALLVLALDLLLTAGGLLLIERVVIVWILVAASDIDDIFQDTLLLLNYILTHLKYKYFNFFKLWLQY